MTYVATSILLFYIFRALKQTKWKEGSYIYIYIYTLLDKKQFH